MNNNNNNTTFIKRNNAVNASKCRKTGTRGLPYR